MKYSSIHWYMFLLFVENALNDPRVVRKYIKRLSPRGYSISVRIRMEDPGFSSIAFIQFHANVNRAVVNLSEADFSAIVRQPTDDGEWVCYNINQHVEPDKLIIIKMSLNATFNGGTTFKLFYLGEFYLYPSESIINIQSPNKEICDIFANNCELSLTTVSGKSVCKGELIFQDNFDVLNTEKKWKHQIRIPTDNKDSFVSFQSRSQNCYVEDGQLHIIPTLLSDATGFNESSIRTGHLHLENCTPLEKESLECRKKAQNYHILPPIVSAKIRTKDSFTFRYGEVVIRAKLPKGDWLFPLILLEPLENYYGYSASGQMSVALSHGNKFLLKSDGTDISGKTIFGGPILTDDNLHDIRTQFHLSKDELGNEFHNYSLIWSPVGITLKIDDFTYGNVLGRYSNLYKTHGLEYAKRWYNGYTMTPFDREFFLTLGLSVGGHIQFPDGCLNGQGRVDKPWKNNDPKAMLNFWKDRINWQKTWKGNDAGLHIDFIKVYAL